MTATIRRQKSTNDVSIVVGASNLSGWQEVRIERSCERIPSHFDISLTERFPTEPKDIVITPGDPCVVYIGADVVITGYVDRYSQRITARDHAVRIVGRGKCQDLVDCSAFITRPGGIPTTQIYAAGLLSLATDLAKPFGITVRTAGAADFLIGLDGLVVQENFGLGETPFDIIEEAARYAQAMVYEGTDGNLILATVGQSAAHAQGFAQGVNIEAAENAYTMDNRYSQYWPAIFSTDIFSQFGGGQVPYQPVLDKGVPRFRPKFVVSEQFQNAEPIATKRAQWEMSRRFGRSQAVHITCDSWRDAAGVLWAPNAYAPISIPSMKMTNLKWIIGEVAFLRDGTNGTRADLMLMPAEAFTPEPGNVLKFDVQIARALQAGPDIPSSGASSGPIDPRDPRQGGAR